MCEWRLKRLKTCHVLDQQALPVDEEEAAPRLGFGKPRIDHGAQQQRANAGARRAGTEHRDALLAQRHARHVDRADERADRYGGGALNIVIECAKPIAIARQQPVGVADREILPMQQDMRPAFAHGVDKRLDKVVVFGPAHTLMAPADIERFGQMLGVRPDVENDRQGRRGMQAGARRVERQLADRNAHAAGPLIAEAQDALAIADDNGLHRIEARMTEDAAYGAVMREAQKQAARLAKNAAELLAAEAYRRRIDDRHHLFEVLGQKSIEQSLVGILQPAQEDVLLQIAPEPAKGVEPAPDLHVEFRDMRRQESVQVERVALGLRESRAFVQERIVQEFVAAERGVDRLRRCFFVHRPWRPRDQVAVSGGILASGAAMA